MKKKTSKTLKVKVVFFCNCVVFAPDLLKEKADFKYLEMFTRFAGIAIFNLSLNFIKRKKTKGGTFSDATSLSEAVLQLPCENI